MADTITPEDGLEDPGKQAPFEHTRTGLSAATLRNAFLDNLYYVQARFPDVATLNDYYLALAYTVRDRLLHRWVITAETYLDERSRTVCFFSAEYLLGPQLGMNILKLGIEPNVAKAMEKMGLDLDSLLDQELEPGLGTGGLGRLAACFQDSLATLQIPAIAYGIRYEFGVFTQAIRDGWQVERANKWLRLGNPWEVERPEIVMQVKLGGHTEHYTDVDGRYRVRWIPERIVNGEACDISIPGYGVNNANMLRLWKSVAPEDFDFAAFNEGEYYKAVESKIFSENISKVLYPNDVPAAGQQLRLEQQYFFVSCSLQDMIRIYRQRDMDLNSFHEKYTVQLNDTHPAVAVPELMRLLVDEYDMVWETAWDITCKTFAYTNHTLLPEALERWPVELFQRLLPRLLEIIYEINRRFLDDIRGRYPGNEEIVAALSLIDETGPHYVRMAHLAAVGSHAINGVSSLHTRLLQERVLANFHQLWPERFHSITNGVSPRRFLVLSNRPLTSLLNSTIGKDWPGDLDQLRRLEPLADDAGFREDWQHVKQAGKQALAAFIEQRLGIRVDPASLFDVQVKRIHEYKRQHLNILHVLTRYLQIKHDHGAELPPRTVIISGKAAPNYSMAKLIIKLVHNVAEVINQDPQVDGRLKLVFLPDYCLKLGQSIYPAADLSQQISTAGTEASGTSNMKLALNGALTLGTLDGSNVEIREAVGEDNFFHFGLSAEESQDLKSRGYDPRQYYQADAMLREVIDLLGSGVFSHGDRELFQPLIDALLGDDTYMLMADYRSYLARQVDVEQLWLDPGQWTAKSILNVARMGRFSSDRAIREYCRKIWHVEPVNLQDQKR